MLRRRVLTSSAVGLLLAYMAILPVHAVPQQELRFAPDQEHWLSPLDIRAWPVVDGELHFALIMSAEERTWFVMMFWKLQRLLAQHDLARGYSFWLHGAVGKRLELKEVNVETHTMVCRSDVPLHLSARQFLRDLGCLWPES